MMLKVFLPENYGKKRLDKIVLTFLVLYIHIRIWVESHVLSFWDLIFLCGALQASDLCLKQVYGAWSSRIHQKNACKDLRTSRAAILVCLPVCAGRFVRRYRGYHFASQMLLSTYIDMAFSWLPSQAPPPRLDPARGPPV